MTSRALSNNGFKKQLVWNLKSQKWLIIGYVVIRLVISSIVSMLICMPGQTMATETMEPSVLRLLNDVSYSVASPLMVVDISIGTLFSFILLNTLFAFLYSKRKTDLYHGFPITRGAYYFAALLTIVIANLISLLSEWLFVALISKIYAGTSFVDLGVIFTYELLIFALLFAVTGILALCISVSGMVVSYLINAVLILIVSPLAVYALILSFESIIPAFADTFGNMWSLFPYGLVMSLLLGKDISIAVAVPVSLLVGIVSGAVGLYFYRTRKSECSESHPSSNIPFYFGVMSLSVFAGIMAYISALNIYITIAAAAVIALVVMFIMNFISEKRVRKSTVFYWLGFSCAFAGVILTAKYGTASYTNRVPEVSQVESVVVESVQGYGPAMFIDKLFGTIYTGEGGSVKLSQEESLKLVNAFHKESLSKINNKGTPGLYQKLTYTLKDGSTVARVLPAVVNYEDSSEGGYPEVREGLLESYRKLTACKEYTQKEAMPYEEKDLASVYVAINDRAMLLKGEDARKFFNLYIDETSSGENGEEPNIIPNVGGMYADMITPDEGLGYEIEVKFVFFTDKTTDAAKKSLDEISVGSYRNLHQSNKLINVLPVSMNISDSEKLEKFLEEKGMFAPAAPIDKVTDEWKIVVTEVDYSYAENFDIGVREYVYPRSGGNAWDIDAFESVLKGTDGGDFAVKTYVRNEYDYDRNHLLQNAKSFDAENAVNDFISKKTGYVYYFTNTSNRNFTESTKLYYASELK